MNAQSGNELDIAFWLTVGSIFLLVCFSAFFSGSETALTSASRGKLRSRADRGERRAAVALGLTGNLERLIGAVLLGNNLVNILAASLATSLFTKFVGDAGVALATLVMTLLLLVFAELMPKTYAIARPEQASCQVAPAIRLFVFLLFPIVAAVQTIVRQLLKLFGLRDVDEAPLGAVNEEIAGTVALGHAMGTVEKAHRDRILGTLDLSSRTVEEIMLHRSEIEMIDAATPPESLYEQCLNSNFTRLPVYKGDNENIIGVLHARDVLRNVLKILREGSNVNGPDLTLNLPGLLMEPYFVPETTTLDEQMRQFLARHTHFALVVDEYGALQGLITLEDILEEIVGEITDEFDDSPVDMPRRSEDGSIVVNGGMSIRVLNREMDWKLPDSDANSIAGLVIHGAQSIPVPGQEFSFYGFNFRVLDREDNRITRLRITRQ